MVPTIVMIEEFVGVVWWNSKIIHWLNEYL